MRAWEVVRRLARRQHWVVGRRQLLRLGLTPDAIQWALDLDRLIVVHRGVYLVDHVEPPPLAREAAAILCCHPALLSHQTAAYLHKLLPHPARPVHVTVIGRALAQRDGLRVHRTAELGSEDRTRRHGLPCTGPARTLLDLAATTPEDELEAVVAAAIRRELVTGHDLEDQLERHAKRPGTTALRALLATPDGPAFTRSRAERILLRLIRDAGLPPPRANRPVAGFEVDLLWPGERLIVELDGFSFHGDRAGFENDRRRDAALSALGYLVVRITWRRLTGEPHRVLVELARVLERRSAAA